MQCTLSKAAMRVVAAGAGHIAARMHTSQRVAAPFVESGKLLQVAGTTSFDLLLRVGDWVLGHVNLMAIRTGQTFDIVLIKVPTSVTVLQVAAQAN